MIRAALPVAIFCLWTAGSGHAETQGSTTEALARKATDPTASLMAFNFLADYIGSFHGSDEGRPGDALTVSFRPVIPFTAFGRQNIIRLTLPYQVSGRGSEGLQDVTVFDLVVTNQEWGRWGIEAVANLATDADAEDSIALGPAAGAVWRLPGASRGFWKRQVTWFVMRSQSTWI